MRRCGFQEGHVDALTELDEALTRLATSDRRQSEMLEAASVFFGGLLDRGDRRGARRFTGHREARAAVRPRLAGG